MTIQHITYASGQAVSEVRGEELTNKLYNRNPAYDKSSHEFAVTLILE